MEFGIIHLKDHKTVGFVTAQRSRLAATFALIVMGEMTGYNHASGGTFQWSPMHISYYAERVCIMIVGQITQELYDQVQQRMAFELARDVFEKPAKTETPAAN